MRKYQAAMPPKTKANVPAKPPPIDRKSTRLNSSHANISYAVFCLKKKKNTLPTPPSPSDSTSLAHIDEALLFVSVSIHELPDTTIPCIAYYTSNIHDTYCSHSVRP